MKYLFKDWGMDGELTSPLEIPDSVPADVPTVAQGPVEEITDVAKKARENTDESLETILEVMRDRQVLPSTRLAAANSLLDWGWRKQTHQVVINNQTNVNIQQAMPMHERIRFGIEVLNVLKEAEEQAAVETTAEELEGEAQ